jgi:hypothetical protein
LKVQVEVSGAENNAGEVSSSENVLPSVAESASDRSQPSNSTDNPAPSAPELGTDDSFQPLVTFPRLLSVLQNQSRMLMISCSTHDRPLLKTKGTDTTSSHEKNISSCEGGGDVAWFVNAHISAAHDPN